MDTKECNRCKKDLPITAFYAKSDGKFGVEGRCKACKKETRPSRAGSASSAAYWQIYYAKNGEALNQRYQTNPSVKEYQLGRYHANPEKFKKQHESYRKANLAKLAAKEAKRRSLKLCATPAWLTSDQLLEIEGFYWLAKDLKAVTGQTYHVDHIVPLRGKNVCGLHVPWNLQILPSDINLSKNNRFEDK